MHLHCMDYLLTIIMQIDYNCNNNTFAMHLNCIKIALEMHLNCNVNI